MAETAKITKSSTKSRQKAAKGPQKSSFSQFLSKINKQKIAYSLFVLAWSALSLVACQTIISFLMFLVLGKSFEQPFWTLIFYILSFAGALSLIILVPPRLVELYYKRSKKRTKVPKALVAELDTNLDEIGLKEPPTFIDIGLAPIGYISYLFLLHILELLMQIFPWYNASQEQNVGFGYFITGFDRIAAMFALIIIAPIAEEIIFRGWVYGKLRTKSNYIVAMLLTSLLFGLLHGQWNVSIATFSISVVLCTLREITGSIWSGILLHMLSNGIAFYILYVYMM